MPGTPINRDDSIEKLQTEQSANGLHDHQEQQNLYDPQLTVRELTQTDRLNKRLLESVLERLSKSGELDKFVDKEELDKHDMDKGDF